MRFVSIRRIGVILVLVGILIGVFGFWNDVVGSVNFPGVDILVASWLGLGYSTTWWNLLLWPMVIGFIGLTMVKYG